MSSEYSELIEKARENIRAAKVLLAEGLNDIAASRAYYAMFYIAEALLDQKGLRFSSHGGVHSAFGRELAKSGEVPVHFHRNLLDAFVYRSTADYETGPHLSVELTDELIAQAEEFVKMGEQKLK